jgi:regulator of protease activity HflC (stomatin/prohibitin superfamily)
MAAYQQNQMMMPMRPGQQQMAMMQMGQGQGQQPQQEVRPPRQAPPMGDKLPVMIEAEEMYGEGASLENSILDGVGLAFDCCCCLCAGAGMTPNLVTVDQASMGVITKFGKFDRNLPAGRHRYNICSERAIAISLMQQCVDVKRQHMMSADNLGMTVDAVTYFQVFDAQKAAFLIEDYMAAVSTLVQVALRTVVGEYTLAEVLMERQKISSRISQILEEDMADWGVKVNRVEMKSIDVTDSMQRALAAKSEAEQQAEAKIIQAKSQRDAALILAEAGKTMQENPAALKLQWFETMRVISTSGKNVTIVAPDSVSLPKKR